MNLIWKTVDKTSKTPVLSVYILKLRLPKTQWLARSSLNWKKSAQRTLIFLNGSLEKSFHACVFSLDSAQSYSPVELLDPAGARVSPGIHFPCSSTVPPDSTTFTITRDHNYTASVETCIYFQLIVSRNLWRWWRARWKETLGNTLADYLTESKGTS